MPAKTQRECAERFMLEAKRFLAAIKEIDKETPVANFNGGLGEGPGWWSDMMHLQDETTQVLRRFGEIA